MLDPYEDNVDEFYINVFVNNPRVEDRSYVSYEIIIETNNISFTASNSAVRRRYSEFVQLHKLLIKEYPAWKLPTLPPKHPFKDHFHPTFVENRRIGLEEYIKKLVSEKIFLSSKALHLFLQSNFSLTEIKDIIHGNKEFIKDPIEFNDNSVINERLPVLDSASNMSDDLSNSSVPSHAQIDVSVHAYPETSSTDHLGISPKVRTDVSSESRRKVSFCDQVTVAQIILE